MTLHQVPFTASGGSNSAEQIRNVVANLIASDEGVVGVDSLVVTEMEVPGPQVRIGRGGYVIRGRVSPDQGNYSDTNEGDAFADVPSTGASARNDMLVLRVEDPEYEGTLDPKVDNIQYFHLISGVPAGARTLEDAGAGGMSATPVARIEMPPNTATVVNDYIKDIRVIANPRSKPSLFTAYPTVVETLTSTTFAEWPSVATHTVDIPPWATHAIVRGTIAGVVFNTADVLAHVRLVFTSATQETIVNENYDGTASSRDIQVGGELPISAAQRGTSVEMRVEALRSDSGAGTMQVGVSTAIFLDVTFVEKVTA